MQHTLSKQKELVLARDIKTIPNLITSYMSQSQPNR